MGLVEQLRAWSYRRQRLDRSGCDGLMALREVIAVYSTHPTAPLALLARGPLTQAEYVSLEQERQAIRIIGMRGSAFLVPTENAARLFAAARISEEQLPNLLRPRGLDLETYRRLTPLVLECAAQPVTPTQLRVCANTDEDVYMVARVLAREGRILRVGKSLRADQLKYVATDSWLARPLEEINRAEALVWLAHEYLRAFGPARVADFAWWAGQSRRAAAAALDQLPTATVGQNLLLLRDDAELFVRTKPLTDEEVAVVPKWDSYTMGYAPDGRQRFVEDRHLARAYTSVSGSPGATSGDGVPLILRGGCAVANWSHRFAGERLEVIVEAWEGQKIADDVFNAIGELLRASSVTIRAASASPGAGRAR